MHEMQCVGNRETHALPTTDELLSMYNTMPFVCFSFDEHDCVTLVSPQSMSLLHRPPAFFVGMSRTDCVQVLSTHNASVCGDDRMLFATVENSFKNNMC
jgi:hypothetical protein